VTSSSLERSKTCMKNAVDDDALVPKPSPLVVVCSCRASTFVILRQKRLQWRWPPLLLLQPRSDVVLLLLLHRRRHCRFH
jgi:hypothetical protein